MQTSTRLTAAARAGSDTGESDEEDDTAPALVNPAGAGLIKKLAVRVSASGAAPAQGAAVGSTAKDRAPPPPIGAPPPALGGGLGASAIRPFEKKDSTQDKAAAIVHSSPANSAAAAKAIQPAPHPRTVPTAAEPSKDAQETEEEETETEEEADDSEEAAEALELHKNLRWQLGMVVYDDSNSCTKFSQARVPVSVTVTVSVSVSVTVSVTVTVWGSLPLCVCV